MWSFVASMWHLVVSVDFWGEMLCCSFCGLPRGVGTTALWLPDHC